MPTIYDTRRQAYLLDGDIMKEIEKDPEYNDYYNQFNRMEDINIDPDGDVWVNVSKVSLDDEADSVEQYELESRVGLITEQYELESRVGLITPFIKIGCRIFRHSNRTTLLDWLMGNEKLKPLLEKREQEIKAYYDRRISEETSTI